MDPQQQNTASANADLSLDNLSALLIQMKDDEKRHPHIRAIAGVCAALAKHIQRIGQRAGASFVGIEQRLTASEGRMATTDNRLAVLESQTKDVIDFLNAAAPASEPAPTLEPQQEAPKPEPAPVEQPVTPAPRLRTPKKQAGGAS